MVSKEELIELLNRDLELEHSSAIQYINHAAKIKGAEFSEIQKELLVHAKQEIEHAIILAQQIDELGGDPSMAVGETKTSKNAREMLQQDLDGERDAIKRYSERIKQAEELGLFALSQKLREIIAVEQEHEMDLKQALGIE